MLIDEVEATAVSHRSFLVPNTTENTVLLVSRAFPTQPPSRGMRSRCRHCYNRFQASKGRSRSRIPALTWLHPMTGAGLSRSSEPLAGFRLNPSLLDDDNMLNAIRATVDSSPGNHVCKKVLRIMDARSVLSANAHRFLGKGHENIARLGGDGRASITFSDIPNAHAVQQNFNALVETCRTQEDNPARLVHLHVSLRREHRSGAYIHLSLRA